VEIPRLHNIATEFQPSHELAQQLWKESVRECRILATILQPVDSFLPEIADIWVDDIRTLELAQVASLNLFSRLPYASDKVFQWIASEREITQQCGYLTLCHIMRKGEMNERSADEFIDQALTAYAGGSMMLQRTLMRAFAIFAENNPSAAKRLPKEFR
jgi:hypothetical protein